MKNILLLFFTAALISGCTIPRAVFKSSLINQDDPKYSLVEVTSQANIDDSVTSSETITDAVFKQNLWYWKLLTAGDVLQVTILSSGGAQYLSASSNGDRADFDHILVTEEQTVEVPYAGVINVRGLDVTQLAEAIRKRLLRVVLNPQVLVTLTARTGAMVTLQGSGLKTGRYPVDQSMNQLSHLLAVAMAENIQADMTEISVTRQQRTFHARLADIYQYPELDISLQPDDRVTIRQVTEYVNVLGAAGEQGKHALVKPNSSVIDALALARGMNDNLADPRAVFLFKHNENELAAQQMRKPYIYHIDMSQPDSVFRARTMKVEDGDVIYISNASLSDFAKVKAAFDTFLSSGANAL